MDTNTRDNNIQEEKQESSPRVLSYSAFWWELSGSELPLSAT